MTNFIPSSGTKARSLHAGEQDEMQAIINAGKTRMHQLADQSLDAAVSETWSTLTLDQLRKFQEKFAELIVQACIELVRGEYVCVMEDSTMMKDAHWDGYVQCGVDSVVEIRNHFGLTA